MGHSRRAFKGDFLGCNWTLFQLSHATRIGFGTGITLSFALIKLYLLAEVENLCLQPHMGGPTRK